MYKAIVRSHLDCDVIYHLPPLRHQASLGVSLNSLMEKSKGCNIKLHLLLLVPGMVQVLNYMRNWDGNHYLIVAGVGVFYRFIKYITTKHHII